MRLARQAATFLAVAAAMTAFLLEGLAVRLLVFDPQRRRRHQINMSAGYARLVAALLDVRVKLEGELEPSYRTNMYVCNHMSYLDVVVISTVAPACFVTSEETRCKPVLGWLCALGGCLFVERRRKTGVRRDLERVERALAEGFDVAVFPEATSTAGDKVLAFRPALFRSAAQAAAYVQPLHLRYESIDGRPLDSRTRDLVCWYGDMTFVPHLWKLAGCRAIVARLGVLEPMPAAHAEPRELSERAYERVCRRHEAGQPRRCFATNP